MSLDPSAPADPQPTETADVPPVLGPWTRDDLRVAALRGLLTALALRLVLGPWEWVSLGAIVAGLALLDRWDAKLPTPRRVLEHVVLAGVLGGLGFCAVVLNGVYLRAGGGANGADAVVGAWRALSVPVSPNPFAVALPWWELWSWADSGRCLVATGWVVGGALAFVTACGHLIRGKPSWWPFVVLSVPFLGCCLSGWVLPPRVPPENSFTSAQGFEEAFAFLALPLGLVVGLGVLDATLGKRFPLRPVPPGGQRARARPPVFAGCLLAWAGAWTLLVVVPERIEPPKIVGLIADLDAGGARRQAALHALKHDAVSLRTAWPRVLPCLEDADATTRRLAAVTLRKTTANEDEALAALLEQTQRERDPAVLAECMQTVWMFQRWRWNWRWN